MLIKGSAISDRTDLLIKKYIELIENGVRADEILVLVQNSFKKDFFINEVKKRVKINHFEDQQIHSFYGLCYNTIKNYWPYLENLINSGTTVVSPYLTGLEVSQFFFRQAIKEVGFKDYNSKINLIHQLFRRYSLIVNNNLTDSMIDNRSKILGEVFDKDAKCAIDLFKKKTLEYRAFDYLRQVSLFSYLYKNENCFTNIKYLLVDDADETTPSELDFITYLKPQLEQIFIGYDQYGSSRLGFLNTDIKTIENIESVFQAEKVFIADDIKTAPIAPEQKSFTRRLEMIEEALNTVEELISNGMSPSDISIITPEIDSILKFAIQEKFEPKEISYQYLSGSEKLCDNKTVKNVLAILKISIGEEVDVYDIRAILHGLMNIPLKYCMQIVENYKTDKCLNFCNLKNNIYNSKLKNLIQTITDIKASQMLLSEKIFNIYTKIVLDNNELIKDTGKLNFFMKQIRDFETVFEEQKQNISFQKLILSQIENSIISENPYTSPEIKDDAVIISTAQKIIDFSIKTKYQIWIDTSSTKWIRDDFGTLYNAWVFQKSWNKDSFTYEDNIELSKIKTEKMLRKLSLLAKNRIFAYSSLFDTQGIENFGGIDELLLSNATKDKLSDKYDFKFTPREDQRPVLEYKNGNMSISAVPGAGKTTILLALLIKLLKRNIKSENIFVLTYMESAARNFKERIKKACPNIEKLPNISTIHGLALKILKENSNFVRIGLDENFEVCDDTARQKIMREILLKLQYNQDDYEKYQSAVSSLKLSDIRKIPYTKDSEISKFLKFFNTYNLYLKSKNIIDYDDMLVLSVKLLENNKDIAEYYQELCHYIIEDEAQDSSYIQQKLLNILSQKNKNLIRCGDINQAITTTFTNADMEGFRNFIKGSKNVTMNHSQRCTKDIYTLANNLIEYSNKQPEYKNAFFDIKMQGVKGKNPEIKNAVNFEIFDNYKEERNFLLSEIRKIFTSEPDSTIAILVRNNYNVAEYSEFLKNYGFVVLTRGDILNQQPIFSLILALQCFCTHPWQNETVIECAKIMAEQKLLDLDTKDIDFLKNLKTPFITINQDDIESQALCKLLWDLNYWLENSSLNMEEFTIKAGLYYYSSEIEKSNVYLTALLFKNYESQYQNRDVLIDKLQEASQKPAGSRYRFFTTDEKETTTAQGAVQIMTYHKSKGDEFDYVFLPELTDKIVPLKTEDIKIKSKERFLEAIKALNSKYKYRNENEQKIIQIEENLRLMYVAFTRAKKKLFITSAQKYKKFAKITTTKPSILFDILSIQHGEKNAK